MVRGASMPRNPEMRIRLTATTTGLPLPLTGDQDQPLEELAFIKGLHLGALLNGTKNRGVMPARRAATVGATRTLKGASIEEPLTPASYRESHESSQRMRRRTFPSARAPHPERSPRSRSTAACGSPRRHAPRADASPRFLAVRSDRWRSWS